MAKKKKGMSITELAKSLSEGLKTDQTDNALDWVLSHGLKTEEGRLFTFDNRKFMIPLFKDKGGYNGEGGKLAVMASAQVNY